MAFDINDTLNAVHSHISRSGYFSGGVQIGEYTAPPDATMGKFAAALMVRSSNIVTLFTDGGTRELHVIILRLYADFKDQTGNAETRLAKAISEISSNLLGDADLGSTIMNIDPVGQYGTSLSTQWGHVSISDRMYRVADVTLPLIIDDSATATP